MYPERDTFVWLLCLVVFAIGLFKGKSRYITKHFIYDPSGNYLVLFSLEP